MTPENAQNLSMSVEHFMASLPRYIRVHTMKTPGRFVKCTGLVTSYNTGSVSHKNCCLPCIVAQNEPRTRPLQESDF